jgi:hypothetical protein
MKRLYFLFITLVIVNIIFFVRRNAAPSYSFSDYSTVYYPRDCFYVDKIFQQNDTLKFSGHFPKKLFYKSVDNKKIFKKDSLASFHILPGRHIYQLTDSSSFYFSCAIDFTQHADYLSKGNSTQSHIQIIHCNLPIINVPKFFLSDWAEKNQLNDSVLISNWLLSHDILQIESPVEKINKLCRSLLDTLHNSFGVPSDSMNLISPYQQFIRACNKKNKIWCVQTAQIYSAFANEAGIPTRLVGILGSFDKISLASHSVAESYISSLQKWVMIDLSSEAWEIHSDNNQFYNAVEVAQLVKLNTINQAKKEFYKADSPGMRHSDSLLQKNFGNADRFFYLLKKSNSNSLFGKITNYISPQPVYIFYSFENHSPQIIFYLRDFFLISALIVFLFIIIHFLIL